MAVCGMCQHILTDAGEHLDANYPCPRNHEYQQQPKEPAMTQPALTKDQASDLRQLHERVVETRLMQATAGQQASKAQADYDNYVHSLQHPKQGA